MPLNFQGQSQDISYKPKTPKAPLRKKEEKGCSRLAPLHAAGHSLLDDLLDILGSEQSFSERRAWKSGNRLLSKLAVGASLQSSKAVGAVLVADKDVLASKAEAHHAGQETAGGDGLGVGECSALGDGEVGDGVGLLSRDTVRDVDVLVVGGEDDLTDGSLLDVLGRGILAVGGDGLVELEGECVLLVADGVDESLVAQLAGDDVVGGLLATSGVEDTVTGTAASRDGDVLGDLVSIVLGVNDDNRVSAEIVDGKVAARGVQVGLVRVRSSLALLIGAKLARGLESLDKLQAAVLGVPDIDGAVTVSGTNKTGLVRVELEVDNTSASSLLGLERKLVGLEIKLEETKLIGVLVDGVEQVGGDKVHPRVAAHDLLLEAELELACLGGKVGDVDVTRVAEEDARRRRASGGG